LELREEAVAINHLIRLSAAGDQGLRAGFTLQQRIQVKMPPELAGTQVVVRDVNRNATQPRAEARAPLIAGHAAHRLGERHLDQVFDVRSTSDEAGDQPMDCGAVVADQLGQRVGGSHRGQRRSGGGPGM